MAIAIIQSISSHTSQTNGNARQVSELLNLLETATIIFRKKDCPTGQITSYELIRPINDLSLLDVLEAIGEHLDCNHPTTEEFYSHYGASGRKLGVVNHMTRLYLKDIKLLEL